MQFLKGYPTVCPASLFFSSRNHHYNFHAKFFRYKCRFQTYRAITLSRNIHQVKVKTIRSRKTFFRLYNSVIVIRLLTDISTDFTFHIRERGRERDRDRRRKRNCQTKKNKSQKQYLTYIRGRQKHPISQKKMKNFVFSDNFHQIILYYPRPFPPPVPRPFYPRSPPPLPPPTAPFTPVPPAPLSTRPFMVSVGNSVTLELVLAVHSYHVIAYPGNIHYLLPSNRSTEN